MIDARFSLVQVPRPTLGSLANDVRRGMVEHPRTIPPKYFYDAAGSALFDQICELPEYYLTRAERALLETHAESIVARTGARELVELGSGMARKTGLLLGAMARVAPHPRYVPLDIAPEAIEASARDVLRDHPTLYVRGVVADFQHDLPYVPLAPTNEPRLFAFLGSTIGNLDEDGAPALMGAIAARMRRCDAFLLGVDLVKDPAVLYRAYNDAAGVTARFNRNVLAVINRSLDADFDLAMWDHEAEFVASRARIEMHLRSSRAQRVHVRALDLSLDFLEGERVMTEISRKFTHQSVVDTLRAGGLEVEQWLTPPDRAFALALASLR